MQIRSECPVKQYIYVTPSNKVYWFILYIFLKQKIDFV